MQNVKIMSKLVIAYDLGTGGIKSSAIDIDGNILQSVFISYPTFYNDEGWIEQYPED